ncbi:MAG: hypothetical protein LJF04_06850 [Gemmatimonadetes bacterium]|nr:hypothetical protein [Gemmatimonadota bacterium]
MSRTRSAGHARRLLVVVAVGLTACKASRDLAERLSTGGDRVPVSVDTLGVLPRALDESSGLAVSRAHPGVYWSHNDSGDRPRLYAIDDSARLLGTWRVRGAHAVDWEDISLGPCPGGVAHTAPACLYVADMGDNDRQRTNHEIYIVAEPDPGDSVHAVPLRGRLRFRYPDVAHDAEALAVHPDGGLVVVTKGRTPTILLYRLGKTEVADAVAADTLITLPPGVVMPIKPNRMRGRVVTGADFNPDGTVLAVRTYSEIYFYRWPIEDKPVEAYPTCFLGALEPQGEGVAFEQTDTLLLTSESVAVLRGALLRVRCGGVGG